ETARADRRPDDARRYYQRALQANPDDHWCRGHLAQLEYEQGHEQRAVALYEGIIASADDCTWALVELAGILAAEHPQRAEELCRQALDRDPSYPWAWSQLGLIARRAGQLPTARDHLRRALEAQPDALWILHDLADTCRAMGRLEEAHAHLDRARSLAPFDANGYGYTADLLREEERFDEALPYLRKAVELDPDYIWAWREMAEILALRGDHAEADAAYQEANRLEPDDPVNDGLKAFLLRCAGEREQALPYLERAIREHPDYLWAWRELCDYHLQRSRPDRAETVAKRSLEQLPDNEQMLMMLADCQRQQGQRQQARTTLAPLIADLEHAPAQALALAAELATDDNQQHALQLARRACELDGHPDYRLLLAQLLLSEGSHDEAAAVVAELAEIADHPPLVDDLHAELAQRSNDLTTATAIIESAIERHPNEPRLLLRLARLRRMAGDQAASRHLYPLFTNEQTLPWREIAHIFATDGDILHARRASAHALQQASNEHERALAWLTSAEVELAHDDQASALLAANHALDHDDLAAARVLIAMLAEPSIAQPQLEHLFTLVDDPTLDRGDRIALLRQIVLLAERSDRSLGDRAWQRIIDEGGDDHETRAERAISLLRRGDAPAAADLLAEVATTDLSNEDRNTILSQLSRARHRAAGPAAAAHELAQHLPLPRALHQRLCQWWLDAGEAEAAGQALAAWPQDSTNDPERALLTARLHLLRGELSAATNQARCLHRDRPDLFAPAALLARCALDGGDPSSALATIAECAVSNSDQGHILLPIHAAALAETAGVASADALFGGQTRLAARSTLGQLWLLAHGVGTPPSPQAGELRALCTCPTLACHLARRLAASEHLDLACQLLSQQTERCRLLGRLSDARTIDHAHINLLRSHGQRRAAHSMAWRLRRWRLLLRGLWS
ncbi:MAG: tetratricopeptide repeat protein, partial [Planctomycetota bacterium]